MNIGNWVQSCWVTRWQRNGNLGVSFMYVGRSKSSHRVGQTCFGHDWHLWQFPMLYTKGWMFNTIRFYKPSSVHSYAFFPFSLHISGQHLAIYRPHSTLTFFIIFVFCLTIKLHLLPVILIKQLHIKTFLLAFLLFYMKCLKCVLELKPVLFMNALSDLSIKATCL